MWNKTEDCSGYAIYRSESVDGEYKWISNVENKSEIFWWQEYESQATFTEKILNWEKHIIIKSDHILHILKERFMVIFQIIKAVRLQLMEQR